MKKPKPSAKWWEGRADAIALIVVPTDMVEAFDQILRDYLALTADSPTQTGLREIAAMLRTFVRARKTVREFAKDLMWAEVAEQQGTQPRRRRATRPAP